MAVPAWPTSLPDLRGQQQQAGTKALHPAPLRTRFDDGPDRMRRRQLYVETPLSMAIVLTGPQFVTFKSFHLNDLNMGAKVFTAPVLLPDLITVAQRACRIPEEVASAPFSPLQWLVSFTLIVRDW